MTVFDEAIRFATEVHAGQVRKGTTRPYILHPLEVATIVGMCTSDPEVLAAAVLHDTVEDGGVTKDQLAEKFGDRVASLVADESEDKRRNLPATETWKVRKEEAIAKLEHSSMEAKLICLGDKLSNLRSIDADRREIGDAIWKRFNVTDRSMHGWYYKSLLRIFEESLEPSVPLIEYRNLCDKLFS